MSVLRILISILTLAAGLCACAPGPKTPAEGPHGATFEERFTRRLVSASWTPDAVTVTCGTNPCPPQVGVLIFAEPQRDQRGRVVSFNLKRCTASLIAADRILTNSHCLLNDVDGYFVLPSGYRRVGGAVLQTADFADATGHGRTVPDVAILTLQSPVLDVPPLRVAGGGAPGYAALAAYVSNANGEDGFRIDRLNCAVRRTAEFPFKIEQNPDVIFAYDCLGQHGNSGSPLLGPDGSVEAVLQSITNVYIVATNVRCQPIQTAKTGSCVKVIDGLPRAQQSRSREGIDRVGTLGDELDREYPYRFKSQKLALVSAGEAFEVIHYPKCLRKDAAIPTELKYPSELVSVSRDARDNVVTTVKDRRITTARVIETQGDRYRVEAQWAESFGPLQREDLHPRVFMGKTFSVDLPRCAR